MQQTLLVVEMWCKREYNVDSKAECDQLNSTRN